MLAKRDTATGADTGGDILDDVACIMSGARDELVVLAAYAEVVVAASDAVAVEVVARAAEGGSGGPIIS